jgi:hypothetical protein
MKKNIALLVVMLSLISGCSFNVQVFTPPPPVTASATPTATQQVASQVATISATVEPPPVGFTPTTSEPIFYGAYAASDSRSAVGQSAFPAGTKEVFAIWTYQNMHAGVNIKREWYLNGKPWLLREEPWDLAKYGEEGVIRDISIFETELSLPSGVYQLKVYIDNVRQPIGRLTNDQPETWLNFEILPSESILELASPDSQWEAAVLNGNLLIVRDENGTPTELFDGREIPHVAWFPDSQHILFVERDRTGKQEGTTLGVRDGLWIVEIPDKQTRLVYESDTALGLVGGLVISPDGRYVAGSVGSGYGDACVVDTQLIFFEFPSDLMSARPITQKQFSGIPSVPDSVVYPAEAGVWQSDGEYLVTLLGTCIEQNPLGPFLFDVPDLTAVKK